jgi:uncharacterized RDD family membrane protein YckC
MQSLQRYDTFFKRLIAGIIDGFVFVPIDFACKYLVSGFGDTFNNSWPIIQSIIWTLYVVIGHGKYGQTLGKRAMAIKVFDMDEKNTIGYWRAFIRELVWFITSIVGAIYFLFVYTNDKSPFLYSTSLDGFLSLITLLWTVLEIVTMLFNSKRRAVHDFMAKSVVVDLDVMKREQHLKNREKVTELAQ